MLLSHHAVCYMLGWNTSSYAQVPPSSNTSENIFLLSSTSGFEHLLCVSHETFPNTSHLVLQPSFLGPLPILCLFPPAFYQDDLSFSIYLLNFPCHLGASSNSSFVTRCSYLCHSTLSFSKKRIGFHSFLFLSFQFQHMVFAILPSRYLNVCIVHVCVHMCTEGSTFVQDSNQALYSPLTPSCQWSQ